MAQKWTREKILRDILRRESAGTALNLARGEGVGSPLYQAASRIFGSWQNALTAAGVSPQRVLAPDRWTPARIVGIIRTLSRRDQPLRSAELKQRYGHLVAASRRVFGSWSGAIIAAGVDPVKLRRVAPWSPERVVEAILQRALEGAPLGSRSVIPRSLAEAGARHFGSWASALDAAGVDYSAYLGRVSTSTLTSNSFRGRRTQHAASDDTAEALSGRCGEGLLIRPPSAGRRKVVQKWSRDEVRKCIHRRLAAGMRLNAMSVYRDERSLYRAGFRLHGNWSNALIAAGLDARLFRRYRRDDSRAADGDRSVSTGSIG